MNTPFVSVIIPVYNDSARLRTCLAAIKDQTLSKEKYEVIVIDNNSTDGIRGVVKEFEQVRLAYEEKPGSYAARNKGISLAKGEVLAFTDSDCIPSQKWLEKGLDQLRAEPNCGFVAGEIKIFFITPEKPNPIELYDSLFNLQQQKYVEEQGWGATANLFAFREVFESVGVFDATLQSGGDAEWGKRVSAAGYSTFYADGCYILHPARHSFSELCRKDRRTVRGAYTLSQTSSHEHILQSFVFDNSFFASVRPPLRSAFRKSYQDKRLKQPRQKTIVFLLVVFFHYLRAFEILRLRTGRFSVKPS